MVRNCNASRLSMAIAAALPLFAVSATIAAPSDGSLRTSVRRRISRAATGPKHVPPGSRARYGHRPGTSTDTASTDGAYDLLMNAGTVFTLRNGMAPYRHMDSVYTGSGGPGGGSNHVTPAPGAALLAALGLSMVGFIRRRVGLGPAGPAD